MTSMMLAFVLSRYIILYKWFVSKDDAEGQGLELKKKFYRALAACFIAIVICMIVIAPPTDMGKTITSLLEE